MKNLLFWTPRVLCILFALFLSLFAFDVFGEGYHFWESVLAFLIHLVPVYVVVLVLVITWKREWFGAIAYLALAIFYPVQTWGQFHWSAYAGISGPLVVIGILFLLNWIFKAQLMETS